MKHFAWLLIALLVVLHQDYWQWNNSQLDFGFLPRAITYHICISLAAAGAWVLAIKFAWPDAATADPSDDIAKDAGP